MKQDGGTYNEIFNISHEIDSKTVKMPNNLVAPQKCSTFATSKQEKRRIAESNMPARSKQKAESRRKQQTPFGMQAQSTKSKKNNELK